MAILVDENTRILVQGITGRFGEMIIRRMLALNTKVVSGVTPGKGGTVVWGIPVFNTVAEALKLAGQVDVAVVVVPGPTSKIAAVEALDAGIKTLLMRVERVPLHDILELVSRARRAGARLIGPGTAGAVSPGKASLGGLGGYVGSSNLSKEAFKPGRIGVISRSGGQTSTLSWVVSQSGLGVSTAVHIGSEPIVGTSFKELLELFEADPETDGVVYFGEIGTVQEEEAAELIAGGGYNKPLVAYIAGTGLPTGLRFSHASAIVEGGRGTAEGKIKRLRAAGVHVVDKPEDIVTAMKKYFVN